MSTLLIIQYPKHLLPGFLFFFLFDFFFFLNLDGFDQYFQEDKIAVTQKERSLSVVQIKMG